VDFNHRQAKPIRMLTGPLLVPTSIVNVATVLKLPL